MDLQWFYGLPSPQTIEFDQEQGPENLSTEFLTKIVARRDCASSGKKVIDDDHSLPGLDRVIMDFKRIGTVLQRVLDSPRGGW